MLALKEPVRKREDVGSLEIKALTSEDFPDVEDLLISLEAVSDTGELEEISDIVDQEYSFGAYVNGKLIGVLLAWEMGFNGAEFLDDGDNALYFEFDIDPKYDGEHVRMALLDRLEEEAREENFDFVVTELGEPLKKIKSNPSLESLVLIKKDFYFLEGPESVIAFKKFF